MVRLADSLTCIGARAAGDQGPLRQTTLYTEVIAFLGGGGGGADDLSGAGLMQLVFMLHHTSAKARVAFETESGVSIDTSAYDDYVCLVSIPRDGDDLGMSLLVRVPQTPHPPPTHSTPPLTTFTDPVP